MSETRRLPTSGRAAERGAPSLAPGASGPAVAVHDVSKRFALPAAHRRRGLNRALDHVSFEVGRGEFFGIVGRNGSGKSTLLRCIAGIYDVDGGRIDVDGRLSPFLELGAGAAPALTARQNILIGATVLGLSRTEARARMPAILEFAELEDYAELPLKNYSSGMAARLAFATAIDVDADVLLLDEVLAVGDAGFQQKCFDVFEALKGRRTIILVSHNTAAIERFCDRALLLDSGRVLEVGEPALVVERYQEVSERPRSPRAHADAAADFAPPRRDLRRQTAAALGPDPRRLAGIVWTLATSALATRFAASRLGFAWAVLRPLLFFVVLYTVFTQVVPLGEGIPHYAVSLLTAVVLWTFFLTATSSAVGSLVANAALIRKLRFPRAAIPLSVVLTALVELGISLAALAALAVATGVPVRASWLEFVPILFVLVLLSLGVALLLSALFVRWRDVGQAWGVAQSALFYGSAVLYPVSLFPDAVAPVLTANPLAAIFTEARHALLGPAAPSLASELGGAGLVLVPLALVLALLGAGTWVFLREVTRMAENA